MANSYKAVYLQIVFAVKNRKALLHKSWRNQLFAYTSDRLTKRDHYALAVNGVEDHIHIFIDYNTNELICDLVREIKKLMTNFIKNNNLCSSKFEWQSGYGVFSYHLRDKGRIIEYIRNQEQHHQSKRFKVEYLYLLTNFEMNLKTSTYLSFSIRTSKEQSSNFH